MRNPLKYPVPGDVLTLFGTTKEVNKTTALLSHRMVNGHPG